MTDPSEFSKREREEGSAEQEASRKLEENLEKDSSNDEPKERKGEEDPS